MGSVLAGENADEPSPYDFALGGAGLDPSLPISSNGSIMKPGNTIMVDIGGNFTGYMSDMSRVFSLGEFRRKPEKRTMCRWKYSRKSRRWQNRVLRHQRYMIWLLILQKKRDLKLILWGIVKRPVS